MAELQIQQKSETPERERHAAVEEQHQQEAGLLMLGLGQSAALPVHPTARGLLQSYALSIQRSLGNAYFQRTLASARQSRKLFAQVQRTTALLERNPLPSTTELVDKAKGFEELKQQMAITILTGVQAHPMSSLLPILESLPKEIRTNSVAGSMAGGDKLVTAMQVVDAKGTPWIKFAADHNGELAALPDDEIREVMKYLGASETARYFKATEFEGRFDGAVDPDSATITLFFRVKFDFGGAQFGPPNKSGTPEAEEWNRAGILQFKEDYKRVVEEQWSGKGNVKPPRAIDKNKSFHTKVVVTVVESGEHKLINVVTDVPNAGSQEGIYAVSANKPKTRSNEKLRDEEKPVTTTQTAAAHEFGHAIGLGHVHDTKSIECRGLTREECHNLEYGTTAEERRDIMGTGDQLQVIKRAGKILHDDFLPFERIGERWSKDLLPGALAKSNKWSAG